MWKVTTVVLLVLALVGTAIWVEIRSAARVIGLPMMDSGQAERVDVTFAVADFDPQVARLSGEAQISLRPQVRADAQQPTESRSFLLRFSRLETIGGQPAFLRRGGTPDPVKAVFGFDGTFDGAGAAVLDVEPVRSAFWFPFDRYALNVVPNILEPEGGGVAAIIDIERFEIVFKTAMLWVDVQPPMVDEVRGTELRAAIRRPVAFQVLAVMMLVLSIIWLRWLAMQTKVDAQVTNLVGFFVAIWGWRSSLGWNQGIFPAATDYSVLTLSVLAVAIVLTRWFTAPPPAALRDCPECLSRIPPAATRCSHCGIAVAPQSG